MTLAAPHARGAGWWQARRHRLLKFWGTGIAVSVLVTLVSTAGVLEPIQAKSLDLLMQLRGAEYPADVVILAIDDRAFLALGERQPLSRAYIARLVRAAQRLGASVVGLDFDFAVATDEDSELAAAVQEFSDRGVSRVVLSDPLPPAGPLAALARSGTVVRGALEVAQDPDGSIRRAQLLVPARATAIEPALSTAIAARYAGMDVAALAAVVATGRVPAGDHGGTVDAPPERFWRINFVGPSKSFLTIPAGAVTALADSGTPLPVDNPFRGKVVLIGATFRDSRDFHRTPHGPMAGVEVHANLVHMMLTKSFIEAPAWIIGLGLQIVVVLAVGLVVVIARPAVGNIASIAGPLALGLPASLLAFHRGGYWIDFVLPVVTTRLFWRAAATLEHRRIRGAFDRYLSHEVVSRVLVEAPSLAGERRDVTILFSDLRDFTMVSENMDPAELARQLGEYFDAMTETIFEHRGMINDFVGDAIMATFGVPLDDPNHARDAVAAAVAMEAALALLNERWGAAGSPRFQMRIGIHTGLVFAGNVGGGRRTKYAVVGDVVNLASRVQGLARDLDATILVTEATRKALGGTDAMRDRGLFPVKGRNEPVHVHQLLSGHVEGDDA